MQLFHNKSKKTYFLYKKSAIYMVAIIVLFLFIGLLTTIKPAYRFSSRLITELTNDVNSSIFLYFLGMENRIFHLAYPSHQTVPKISNTLFEVATNLKPDDARSLISHEFPGFRTFGNQIIIAGEGTNYMNLSIESSPPLAGVLEEREAVFEEPQKTENQETDQQVLSTGDRKVVLIYNTHNRESFLPHLPGVEDPNLSHHPEVNITKVSKHFKKALEAKGIGAEVDLTDHMSILNEKGWPYGKSYQSSRTVVTEALAANKNIQYIFDFHRDSLPRDKTTKVINGENYAKILMVVGKEYDSFEKNLKIATKLHQLVQDKYPGLSRGVITKGGPGNNGVYNQDLSENALLVEFGGYENTLEELYRTADVVAEVFSEYYWEAEKVNVER